jgi:hypothetical protein
MHGPIQGFHRESARGVCRHSAVEHCPKLALLLTLGAIIALLMTITALTPMSEAGVWSVGGAVLIVLAGSLASGAYVAAQIGGALTRSPLG